MKLLITILTLLTITTAVYAGITISGGTFNPAPPISNLVTYNGEQVTYGGQDVAYN